MEKNYKDVLSFWFEELKPNDWFNGGSIVDQKIEENFLDLHSKAARGELFHWRSSAEGRLAEIIVLDQFSRNIYRGLPTAFAQDTMALVLAQEMVQMGLDKNFDLQKRSFIYMPYMHSESLVIHEQAMKLFDQPGLEFSLKYEIAHKEIIEKFGRFPHRNKILGRTSTNEETEFLKQPGSGF